MAAQVKALLRRATARDALEKYDEAERDLKEVLSLEPNNRQAREDLQVRSVFSESKTPQLSCPSLPQTLRTHKAEMTAQQAAIRAGQQHQNTFDPMGMR